MSVKDVSSSYQLGGRISSRSILVRPTKEDIKKEVKLLASKLSNGEILVRWTSQDILFLGITSKESYRIWIAKSKEFYNYSPA